MKIAVGRWPDFRLGSPAAVSSLAYFDLVVHQPLKPGLLELTDDFRSVGIESIGGQLAPSHSAAYIQRLAAFENTDGIKFIGALHQAGGMALVRRAIDHPPTTTSQLLHPEKYLAGELPTPVAFPSPPPSWSVVTNGHVGELGIQAMFASCPRPANERTQPGGAGWRGDAYTIARLVGGRFALIWPTTWESYADATAFISRFTRWASCWDLEAANQRPVAPYTVRHRGNVVIVTRGLFPNELDPIQDSLFATVGRPVAPAPPFPAPP